MDQSEDDVSRTGVALALKRVRIGTREGLPWPWNASYGRI